MKSNRKKWWRRCLAGGLLALCLGLILFIFLVGTDAGRSVLDAQLSRALSKDDGPARVKGVRLSWMGSLAVDEMSLSDSEGRWLFLRDVELDIEWRALVTGRIELKKVKMALVEWSRFPAAKERGNAKQTNHLPGFRVGEAVVGAVRLGAGVSGVPLTAKHFRATAQCEEQQGAARLGFKVAADEVLLSTSTVEQVEATVELVIRDTGWEVTQCDLRVNGGSALVSCRRAGEGMWPIGKMNLEFAVASVWLRSLWPGLESGKAELEVTSGVQSNDLGVVQFRMALTNLQAQALRANEAMLEGQLRRHSLSSNVGIRASASFRDAIAGGVIVSSAVVRIDGDCRSLNVDSVVKGLMAGQAAELDIGGSIQCGSMIDVQLSRATVGWAGIRAEVSEPLRVRVGNGTNVITAAWHAEVSDMESVSNVVGKGVKGRLVADLAIRGRLDAPEIGGRLACEGLVAPWQGLSRVSAVSGNFNASISNGVLRSEFSAATVIGAEIAATLAAPMQLSLWPWAVKMDRDGVSEADVKAKLDLSILKGMDIFANGRIGGRLDLVVSRRGTLADGVVMGTCTLENGEYENFVLGTMIRKASIRLVASNDTLVVESGEATDGGAGKLSLVGRIQTDLEKGLPYVFEVACRKARLLRRSDASATVSGKVQVRGSLSSVLIDGKVQIDEALIQLQNVRYEPPEELGAVSKKKAQVGERAKGNTNICLRLAIDIPGTLYVRGRTLDSVWAGNLGLNYEGGGMGMSGFLEPRRGTLLLLKRPFKLSEGRLEFVGEWPPDPSFRVNAIYNRTDIQAQVSIVGERGNQEITLSSEPALPEDEILSRVLFGKDMSTVTPLQALSLASEATKLKQMGGGTGIMGGVQDAVGIDRIEFRESGEGGEAPEVAAGKYLGDRSYVEMRRSTSTTEAEKSRIYLEHELRPNVVLEAESGFEMRSGIGIFWKHDY